MQYLADYLVLGSGIAGLRFALEVADHGSVLVLSKAEPDEGNTRYAQGGIASVMSSVDTFESHERDTLEAGAGLCDSKIVHLCVSEGPKEISHLVSLGTNFDKDQTTNEFSLGREAGHSSRRILHAGDTTGAEIQRSLYSQAKAHPNIKLFPHHIAIDLKQNDSEEVIGCYALNLNDNRIESFSASATLLATGGLGKVYLYTSNPDVATGDGIAIAFRAGAAVANMEFIQFHPTCLYHPLAKSFLLTEALRGEGAVLRLPSGERFMQQYDDRAELAPRDIVARAIDDQMKRLGLDFVLLDATHLDAKFLRDRFPMIYEKVQEFGFTLDKDPLPIVPAAHYCCGGILTDDNGMTSLKGLYAAGECAYTGLHGANRLASNSLLEALVFAGRAARHAIAHQDQRSAPHHIPHWESYDAVESSEEVIVSYLWDEVRRLMWNLVGIVRSNKRLALAQNRIRNIQAEIQDYYWKFIVTQDLLELRNITLVAELIIRSAAARKESRGLHYTVDYPDRDDQLYLHPTVLLKGNS